MTNREEAAQLAIDNNYRRIVEVGVWEGDLSKLFYSVADKLILVDPWNIDWNLIYNCTMGQPLKFQQQLDWMYQGVVRKFPRAKVMRMSSLEAAKVVEDSSVDLVYLDSVHTYTYCRAEIKAWLPKICKGGMIAGDDYYTKHREVSRAVDEIFGSQDTDRTWSVRV